jgi:shikimate kinase
MILKLKRTPGIYLVGFMACGKSTIGRLLADTLGWSFADIDEEIERRTQRTITEIFDLEGEEAFRRIEQEAIAARVRSIESGRPTVVALGGGAFARPENYELVTANGVSIWLDCPLETLLRRIAGDTTRPLARDLERFRQLYEARLPAYQRADFRVSITSDDPLAVVNQILKLPIF